MCMDRAIMGQTLIKILRNEVDLAIYKQLLMYVKKVTRYNTGYTKNIKLVTIFT